MTQRVSIYYGMERKSEYVGDLLREAGTAPGPKKGFHLVPDPVLLAVWIKNADDPAEGNTLIHRHGVRVEETDNEVVRLPLTSGALQKTYAVVCRYLHQAGSTSATYHALEVGVDPFTADDTVIGSVVVPALHVGPLASDAVELIARQRWTQPTPGIPIFTVDHPISNVYGEEAVEGFQVLQFGLIHPNAYVPAAGHGTSWPAGADTRSTFSFFLPPNLAAAAAAADPRKVILRFHVFNKALTAGDKLYVRVGLTAASGAFPQAMQTIGPAQFPLSNLQKWDYNSFDVMVPSAFVQADRPILGAVSRVGTDPLDTVGCTVELHMGVAYYPIERVGRQY